MGGKKASLANRLAKMSDEARQRYVKHKADQEEEARRRKEQLINTFLKKKIQYEDAFARLNIAKLNEHWHHVLRTNKCNDLQREVQHLKEYVDRVMSMKNRTIQLLLGELQESEQQYNNNFQAHVSNMNQTIEFSKSALNDLREEYEDHIITLLRESSGEHQFCRHEAKAQEVHMKTLVYQFDTKARRELKENCDNCFQMTDNTKHQNNTEFEELRNIKENQISLLWGDIGNFLKQYVDNVDIHRAYVAQLTSLDTQNQGERENNDKQLKQKQIELDQLGRKFDSSHTERQDSIRQLLEYIIKLKKKYRQQKSGTHKRLQDDDLKLRYLCAMSHNALNYLRKHLEKAEKMLQFSLMCRKLETEEEHATRFVEEKILRPLQEVCEDENNTTGSTLMLPADFANCEGIASVDKMQYFWCFYNKMQIKLMVMQQRRTSLQQDEIDIKNSLKNFMEQRVEDLLDERLTLNAIAKNGLKKNKNFHNLSVSAIII